MSLLRLIEESIKEGRGLRSGCFFFIPGLTAAAVGAVAVQTWPHAVLVVVLLHFQF